MKNAVLAIEDARFYSHHGVDYKGLMRAGIANLGRAKSQGASTITMQVARNVYLSSEKTFTRKLYEVLLTFKLEHLLTKDQILEIYMNQIFLGNRAYGFAAASETYFGKPLKDITIAEAAMLAGLPKAPSAFNPITNPSAPRRASFTSSSGWRRTASSRPRRPRPPRSRNCASAPASDPPCRAEYIAETVRQLVYAQYGDETYTRGLNVFTTVKPTSRKRRTRPCARASWTTRSARSTAARSASSTCPPIRRNWTTRSTTRWPSTRTTAT
jgi:penicillin-binding protein 1A